MKPHTFVVFFTQNADKIAVFGDALSQLKGRLSYLYLGDTGARFWYDNRPALRKMVQDLESRILSEDIEQEIEKRLRKMKSTPDFGGVHFLKSEGNLVCDWGPALLKMELKVNIRLDVDIDVPEGTPSHDVTTVSENCRTLKIENFRFEG